MRNTLYYGDNLTILREHVADELVDVIYLDPPRNGLQRKVRLFEWVGGKPPFTFRGSMV